MAGEFTVELGGKTFKTQAESLQQVWGAVGPDAGAIGALITDPDGNTTYASNTQQWRRNDPAFFELFRRGDLTEKAMTDASELAAPLEETSLALRQERILEANPIASRYASSVQGIPFVGEYGDEIVGSVMGDDTQDQIRAAQAAVADRRPGQAFAGQLGMGVAATLPLAALGTLGRGASLLRTALTGGAVGATGGAIEGGVSGYGSGETPDERSTNALQRAILGGALGGPLGALAPVAGAGISRLLAMRPGQQVSKAAEEAAASPEAMRGAAQLGGMQSTLAAPTLPTSLAEASTPYRRGLDASMSVPNPAIDPTMGLLNRYASEASGRLKGTLDELLGEPSGVRLQQRDLMRDTAERRAEAYDAAYQSPIDYSGEAGEQLQSLIATVDDDIIKRANTLMAREGNRSAQMRVTLDEAGNITGFESLPDVRQIDYITRTLQGRASAAIRAGEAEDVTTLTQQTRRIRQALDEMVPEYRAARSQAAEIIGQREAFEAGYDVLSNIKREDVLMAVEDMTPGELNNVRSGLRQHIDDIMARASSPLDPDGDEYKEAMRALTSLAQRVNQDKMRMVMGDEAADALFAQLKETVPPMLTRMQGVAAGSQTAPRALAQGVIDEGAGATPTGDLPSDLRTGAQNILRYGAKTPNEARQDVAAELAPLLAQQRTPQDFMRMQELLAQTSRAMRRERDLASGGVRFGGVTGLTATPAATRGAEELSGFSPVRGGRR
tara:strand:- start:24922 stop:27102 length:2181 start_codon:yes stop_codon:yes gene_type:complete